MVEAGHAKPHHGHTRTGLAMASALQADEDAKSAQRDKDAEVAKATADAAEKAKRKAHAERISAARAAIGMPGY